MSCYQGTRIFLHTFEGVLNNRIDPLVQYFSWPRVDVSLMTSTHWQADLKWDKMTSPVVRVKQQGNWPEEFIAALSGGYYWTSDNKRRLAYSPTVHTHEGVWCAEVLMNSRGMYDLTQQMFWQEHYLGHMCDSKAYVNFQQLASTVAAFNQEWVREMDSTSILSLS